MRLQVKLEMNTNWLIKDYRRIFMSLIKSVFSAYDPILYVNLYGTEEEKRKVNKPFTFSLHFPAFKGINGNRIDCGNEVSLFFSSDNETLVTAFYNGLEKRKEIVIGENYPINFKTTAIRLLPFKMINTDKVIFKTLSPILVNQRNDNLMFIPPTHPDFDSEFKYILLNQTQEFNVSCKENDVKIEIHSMKRLPLTHYNQTMTSWLGEFTMQAPKEVLQLVFDTGIGVRRSQGFGMLEIQKQF